MRPTQCRSLRPPLSHLKRLFPEPPGDLQPELECWHHNRVWVGACLARQEEQGAILWLGVKISLAILQGRYDLACLFPPYNPVDADAATN